MHENSMRKFFEHCFMKLLDKLVNYCTLVINLIIRKILNLRHLKSPAALINCLIFLQHQQSNIVTSKSITCGEQSAFNNCKVHRLFISH